MNPVSVPAQRGQPTCRQCLYYRPLRRPGLHGYGYRGNCVRDWPLAVHPTDKDNVCGLIETRR